MRCGRNLIRTFLKYYHVTGAIPLQLSSEIRQRKRRPHTHRSRSTTRNSSRRADTSRRAAVLHFTDLNINYDSETSAEEIPFTFRNNFSPRKQFHKFQNAAEREHSGIRLRRDSSVRSPPPMTIVVLPEPTLSIIDFNTITRDDIEKN